jgi:hypothetical protein
MVRTNGTLPYHCYRATNTTEARIGCVPTVPTPRTVVLVSFRNCQDDSYEALKAICSVLHHRHDLLPEKIDANLRPDLLRVVGVSSA